MKKTNPRKNKLSPSSQLAQFSKEYADLIEEYGKDKNIGGTEEMGVWRGGEENRHELTNEDKEKGRITTAANNKKFTTFSEHLKWLTQQINPDTGNTYLNDLDAVMMTQALNGNRKACEFIRDTMGQKPVSQVQLNTNAIQVTVNDDNQIEITEQEE